MTEADKKKISKELEPLRRRLEDADQRAAGWANDRWWPEVWSEHGKIGPNRLLFFVVRIGQVAGAASIPVFATAGTLTSGHTWGWVTVVVSLVVALLVAFDTVYRPGARWRLAYQSYHELIDAAWTYLEHSARVVDAEKDPYARFVHTVEGTVSSQQRDYLRDIANLNTTSGGTDTKR
jgi:uncharacterized protein DUF4231